MSDSHDCAVFEESAAEVALGIATGEERALVLAHAAECEACAERLERLSRAADSLLLLAPAEEPPVGFETRVAEAARPVARPRRRNRLAIALGGVATAALAGIVVLAIALDNERDFSSAYRDTLAEANGEYFTAYALRGGDGTKVGNAFGYEGTPSWVLVTIDAAPGTVETGRYRIQAVLESGRRVAVAPIDVSRGTGSAGKAIDADLEQVVGLRLAGEDGGAPIIGTAPDSPAAP
jgi:hypothetical protein